MDNTEHGRSPDGSGCQPSASAAEVASSQSGIPNALDKLRALQTMCAACDQPFYVQLIGEVLSDLTEETAWRQALISEQSIESLATDIACAIVDPRKDAVAMRHSAMIRLGARLRNPFPSDIKRLASAIDARQRQDREDGPDPKGESAASEAGDAPTGDD